VRRRREEKKAPSAHHAINRHTSRERDRERETHTLFAVAHLAVARWVCLSLSLSHTHTLILAHTGSSLGTAMREVRKHRASYLCLSVSHTHTDTHTRTLSLSHTHSYRVQLGHGNERSEEAQGRRVRKEVIQVVVLCTEAVTQVGQCANIIHH
jgi:hypothetical protein